MSSDKSVTERLCFEEKPKAPGGRVSPSPPREGIAGKRSDNVPKFQLVSWSSYSDTAIIVGSGLFHRHNRRFT